MDRSVWRGRGLATVAAVTLAGCGPSEIEPPATPARAPAPAAARPTPGVAPRAAEKPEVSWDTDRDRAFALFLQDNAAGMVKKAAVGIDRRGELNIEMSRAVEPEDTLPLTKSLMAGARKDFPDRPITLSLYDPANAPVLKARYKPGAGVHYEIARGQAASSDDGGGRAGEPPSKSKGPVDDLIARGGVTPRDQKFADWAEERGRPMLRYVEADLERHGRLWFGISGDVKPDDLQPLVKALLKGARKEFPSGALVATVFDPNGEKIGRARLTGDGDVTWDQH